MLNIYHNLGGGRTLVSKSPDSDGQSSLWTSGLVHSSAGGRFLKQAYRGHKHTGRFLTGLFFCALLLSAPAKAQQDETSPPDTKSGDQTQILTDQDKGTVTIIIDGQPAVMIDKTGLYVVNEIMYGRSLTDTGPDWIRARIEKGADDAQ